MVGYESTMKVSNMGRVKSFHKYKGWLNPIYPKPESRGYCHIRPRLPEGKKGCIRVHAAVYMAFVGPIPTGFTIDHIDRNRSNNNLCNLRLASPGEQRSNQKKHDPRRDARGICVWRLAEPGTVMMFRHAREASNKLGVTRGSLRLVANGKARYAGEFGARWATQGTFLAGEEFRTVTVRNCTVRVSNRGRYLDSKSGAFAVTPVATPGNGYPTLGSRSVQMHAAVASAWPELIGGTPGHGKTIDHIDRNVNNNDPSNLRWATATEQAANRRSSRDHVHA